MKIINSLKSYILLMIGGLATIIVSLLCGINPKNELKYRKWLSKFLIKMIAKEIIIEGNIDKEANLFIGNHTHNLDIALMETVIPEKLIWIAKKELGETPIIKYMLTKTDMILVDRSNKRSVITMLKEVKKRINKGLKIIVFPEGTRNKENPKKMKEWKSGPKALAEKLNLKVQPFVIINLPFAFKQNPFRVDKQKIKVIFLDSFYPTDNNWYERTKEKMQEILNKEYNSINE
ncbi:1-acyl-sn-glycerol-3-phosphate acyltransferase [Caminibacter mediatlanticus TB-2]|uniref:1-acyl-sn-glycerol-3-phosphate acyltransferase n=2 Tax=Caminibacter mediatlanticus TaxID=291048 RepID=A0AAI9AFR6_9BACT|nr:lysophospholipid acyltransferase family protein [Caminibacter mediatlanticus]EDM22838.1 1-acyl-sn-glycerol-3-phosphate acyltransferase, putative [Caminibacter mediatlanticus TB-2]QCT94505.1 1-acyl-sn-glycerol-3-phosphate acyltransferase [Caminibacter mediatlanticus TB-2]